MSGWTTAKQMSWDGSLWSCTTDLPWDVKQYITNVEQFSINNQSTFQSKLSILNTTDWVIGFGAQGPEPTNIAIDKVGLQAFSGNWRSNVAKYIIIFTDNLPGGSDDNFTQTDIDNLATFTADLISNNIKVLNREINAVQRYEDYISEMKIKLSEEKMSDEDITEISNLTGVNKLSLIDYLKKGNTKKVLDIISNIPGTPPIKRRAAYERRLQK